MIKNSVKILLSLKVIDLLIITTSVFLVSIVFLGIQAYLPEQNISIISPKTTPTPPMYENKISMVVIEDLVSNLPPTPTPTPTPANVVESNSETIEKPTQQIEWGETVKIDDELSATRFSPDDHMATSSELNQAMNTYRLSHSLPTLTFDSLLCQIATTRANQLKDSKVLSHDGFSDQAHNQNSFHTMAEVIFGGNQPASGTHIIEWGWDKSLTGHHEVISDPKWTEGCGATADFYAVFIFGKR